MPPILADAVNLDLSPLKPHEFDQTDVSWRAQLLEVKAIWNEEHRIEQKSRAWEQGEAGQVG